MLDLISIGLSVAYIVLIGGGIAASGLNATIRQLTRAIRLNLIAVALAVAGIPVHLLDHEPWWMVTLDVVKVACPFIAVHYLAARRERKGARVVDEAERIVRDYQRDGSL